MFATLLYYLCDLMVDVLVGGLAPKVLQVVIVMKLMRLDFIRRKTHYQVIKVFTSYHSIFHTSE